jgi:hypothetical protein
MVYHGAVGLWQKAKKLTAKPKKSDPPIKKKSVFKFACSA